MRKKELLTIGCLQASRKMLKFAKKEEKRYRKQRVQKKMQREVYCEYDPDSKTGMPGSNRKIKGTIHWVSCAHCLPAEVRLYDRLWKVENPRDEMAAIREAKNCDALEAMKEMINPDSLNVLTNCYVEKYLADAKPLDYLQFQRIGYFNVDKDSTPEHLVFNRTVSLKDTWSKINK